MASWPSIDQLYSALLDAISNINLYLAFNIFVNKANLENGCCRILCSYCSGISVYDLTDKYETGDQVHGCQLMSRQNPPEPIRSSEMPQGPRQNLAMDFIGPLPSGDSMLVVGDYYSHYYEIAVMKTTNSEKAIEVLKEIFARHGLPISVQWQWPSVYLECLRGIHAEYGHRTLSLPAIVAAG